MKFSWSCYDEDKNEVFMMKLKWKFIYLQTNGRQKVVQSLARALGKPLYSFTCPHNMDPYVLQDIFKGFSITGNSLYTTRIIVVILEDPDIVPVPVFTDSCFFISPFVFADWISLFTRVMDFIVRFILLLLDS